jgi:multidrug efflux system outer membrane protein
MKTHIISLLSLLTISLLSACGVSKDLKTPAPELAATFRNAEASDSSAGRLPWREFFTDPALRNLIDSALVRNYDMQVAEKNIEQSRLIFRQTKWGYTPNVNLQVAANSSNPSDNSLNGISLNQFLGTTHIEDFTAGANLSWEADIWGKVRNQKRSAFAAYEQTAEARNALQTRLVAAVAQGYYNLLMLDAQLDVAEKNLALNDSTLQIIRLQYDAGQVTVLAVQQTEAQRLTAAQLVPQFTQEVLIQENALSVLTGRLPQRAERNGSLATTTLPAMLPSGVPADLLSQRPDVRSSELALTIANAQTGITKANLYPSLVITASGGVNAFKLSNWFNIPASLFGTVAGGIVQPLLAQRRLRTQYKLSLVEREKTVLRFRQTVLTAVGEVSDALARAGQTAEQYTLVAKQVETLQSAIGNANLLFQNGMATYLEVITAQSNLLQRELALSQIRRGQLSASVELYRALGGGWQ